MKNKFSNKVVKNKRPGILKKRKKKKKKKKEKKKKGEGLRDGGGDEVVVEGECSLPEGF